MPHRLLIVDDDPRFLEMMRSIAAVGGFDAELCQSSAKAHDLARIIRPAAITLDLRMPEPSGWEVLQAIKSDPILAATPVIVISAAGAALAETADRLRELDYSNVELLAKPFELDKLLSHLAQVVQAVRDLPDDRDAQLPA